MKYMNDTETILCWMGRLSAIIIIACVADYVWLALLPWGFSLAISITAMRTKEPR
jgi:hypothetical protein